MRITVYASMADEVKKKIDRMAKKAAGYGIPFDYTMSDEHPQKVRVYAVDQAEMVQYIAHEYTVSAIDFDIACDELIKKDGWTVLAKIEHGKFDGEVANVVTGFGTAEVDQAWYTAESRCDHCNVKRFRTVTFIVEKDGERKQVGRTCLKDYTGIDPASAAMWAEIRDLSEQNMDCTEYEWHESGYARMYDTEVVIAHAVDLIKQYGYRKADEPNSTKDMTIDRVLEEAKPSAEGIAKAKAICEWLVKLGDKARKDDEEERKLADAAFDYEWNDNGFWQMCGVKNEEAHEQYLEFNRRWDRVTDIERNCVPMAKSGYTKPSNIGRLAYMPIDYERFVEKKEREEQKQREHEAAVAASSYVGEIGKKLVVNTVTAMLVTSWETMYGTTFMYKFTDEDGNVFIWKASRSQDIKDGVTIKGTVKAHSEYNGIKQTVMTYCSVA